RHPRRPPRDRRALHGREDRRLHRRPRARDAAPRRVRPRQPRAADRVRRIAPGLDLSRHVRPCARVPARERLRPARGRQGDRPRRPAPQDHHQLRGGGRGGHGRRYRGADLRRGRRPVSAGSAPTERAGAAVRDPHDSSGGVPREILRQVRLIELRTRGWVESLFGGEYHSVFKGQGMEFAEVRAYQPGDEVRAIDWNVTARMGQPYVKRYVEERELTVLLAVDLSGSEQFGTRGRFKAELAAEIAAVLALSAVRNNDRVGLLVFTDRVEHFVPPRKGRRHVLRLIRDVLAFRPRSRGTDLAAALDY